MEFRLPAEIFWQAEHSVGSGAKVLRKLAVLAWIDWFNDGKARPKQHPARELAAIQIGHWAFGNGQQPLTLLARNAFNSALGIQFEVVRTRIAHADFS